MGKIAFHKLRDPSKRFYPPYESDVTSSGLGLATERRAKKTNEQVPRRTQMAQISFCPAGGRKVVGATMRIRLFVAVAALPDNIRDESELYLWLELPTD